MIAHASLNGSCVYRPTTSRRSDPPSTTVSVTSHVWGPNVTREPSASSASTSISSVCGSGRKAVMRARLPLTQRSAWSFDNIMICAPTLTRRTASVGGSNPDTSPDSTACTSMSSPSSRSSRCRLRAVTIVFDGASVSQSSSSGGSKSGSTRALSSACACSSSTPSRTALSSDVRRSSPSWRNTVVSATVGKRSRSNAWAEKKYGVS